MSSETMFRGYFINMDRDTDRLQQLGAELEARGVAGRYQRLAAIEGKLVAANYATALSPGELGLWLTHEKLIAETGTAPADHIHVLEDDTTLSRNFGTSLDATLRRLDAEHPEWDVLFTEVFSQVRTNEFVFFCNSVQTFATSGQRTIAPLSGIDFCGATSLVLNRRRISRYAQGISGQWALGRPLDLHLRELAHSGELNTFVTVPFITSISAQNAVSSIRGALDDSRQVVDLYRRAFFEDADLPALLREMDVLTKGAKVSLHTALYLRAEMFTMSDRWQSF